jgi:putative tryptophan/tyrosine transport system substrate-binding protein
MRRREFMAALAGAVAAAPMPRLPSAAAQQAEKLRRVGALLGFAESNPEQRAFFAAFVEELARLGWVDGRNVRIEQRWTNADKTRAQTFAAELVASQPDVILCATTPVTAALHQATTTVPVVFTTVSDPVGAGFVAGLPHPGGNMTGFIHTDAAMGGKWVGLLKEIAPSIKRAAIMFNPDTAPGRGNLFRLHPRYCNVLQPFWPSLLNWATYLPMFGNDAPAASAGPVRGLLRSTSH